MPSARLRAASVAVVLAWGLGCGGEAPPLPAFGASPDDGARLPWASRLSIDRALDYRVWSGARAGFVALVARRGSDGRRVAKENVRVEQTCVRGATAAVSGVGGGRRRCEERR